MEELIPVILSGGTGSRLWPLSRSLYPKQLHALVTEHTLVQDTALRCRGLPGALPPIAVCNEEHRFMVAEQLLEIDQKPDCILLEPEGRNTAPAVCLAALAARKCGGDPHLLVLPADQVIRDDEAFRSAIGVAMPLSAAGHLVTFGVQPSSPHTGYGYIRCGDATPDGVGFLVKEFVEKPDLDTAREYVEAGNYLWNSGMFMFRASVVIAELQKFHPEIVEACVMAFENAAVDADFIRIDGESFAVAPDISLDYAVMEKTEKAASVPFYGGWSDVGSWDALHDVAELDADGNALIGNAIAEDSKNCYLRSESRLVSALGVDDVVLIETSDAVLVTCRAAAQDVKSIVTRLNLDDRDETRIHLQAFRPWGSYEVLAENGSYKVKKIVVKPHCKLSLQRHRHRAEHWVVVKGPVEVRRGEDDLILNTNESVFIPAGTMHRLTNSGEDSVEIIEVQTGSYLGEDDIERFDDAYGRVKELTQ